MHIPDGFLAPEVAAVCAVPAIGAVGYGLRRASRDLDERRVPLLGVTAAFVFAVQMLNFPVAGGTSGHFLGAGLAAILLGPWMACLVMSVVLVTQSFVFADGGITALGANILNMGVIGALLVGGLMLLAQRVLPHKRAAFLAVAGVGAWLAVVAGAVACSFELAISGTVPLGTVLPAMLGVHVLIGIGEGVITVAAVSAVLSTRAGRRAGERMKWFTIVALALAVGLATAVSPLASSAPDGLTRVAADKGFAARGEPAADAADRLPGAARRLRRNADRVRGRLRHRPGGAP